jgi:hypothetical protein
MWTQVKPRWRSDVSVIASSFTPSSEITFRILYQGEKNSDSFLGSNAIRVSKQILFPRMAIISVNYLAASLQKSTLKEARSSSFFKFLACFSAGAFLIKEIQQ